MATLAQIYQLEEAVETCVADFLTTAGLTTHRQRGAGAFTSPACAVSASGFQSLTKQHKVGANNFNYPADFAFALSVRVVTERTKNAASHASYVGLARATVFDLSQWSDARLPFHQVAFIEATGSSEELDPENNYDVTLLTFRPVLFVRLAAWPT